MATQNPSEELDDQRRKAFPACVVLAGGRSRRMGGESKALALLEEEPLVAHVTKRIRPQISSLVIAANSDQEKLSQWGDPVIADAAGSDFGPLAGILAGMNWVRERDPDAQHLVSVPVDTPFIPSDFVQRLLKKKMETNADIVVAASAGRFHFVSALWSTRVIEALQDALMEEGLRKVETFAHRHKFEVAEFSGGDSDPFLNVNSYDDLTKAAQMLDV